MAVYKPLFADAKPLKNPAQNFIGGDFADDGAEVIEGFADILADEVGGDFGGKALADAGQGFGSVFQSLDVAQVGDDCGIGTDGVFTAKVGKSAFESVYPLPFFRRNQDKGSLLDIMFF